MKIIDQKGKLFGLINIIDLCVLLIVVLLVGIGGYKFMGNKGVISSNGTKQNITVTTKAYAIRTVSLADTLKKGDQLISLTSPVEAYVDSVSIVQADDKVSTADGRNVKTKDPIRVDLTITFTLHANSKDTTLKLGSQDVAVGKQFEVKTREADINTVISSIVVQ